MKDDVICVARYRQVGHGTIGLRELPIVIWPLVGFKKWHKDARDGKQAERMADEMDINLEVFNLETDFFGDLHCSSRFTDMLCDAQAQYGDYSELEKCPMWKMWKKDDV